jgi:hypothetical protein
MTALGAASYSTFTGGRRSTFCSDFGRPVSRSIYAPSMAVADFKPPCRERRGLSPLCEMSDLQRQEFHEALLDADTFEDLPGKWQAAILKAEENRPKLRIVGSD